ncbi:hypothetical protein [Gracilibacillus timonensis]|uniref:hypothetical protein n=1 Tax=Gracilibacillus timonensis TaxID=1816696 RepID=UPI0008253104|nr:hypothetical protein [Gracilibacillus timonensis]
MRQVKYYMSIALFLFILTGCTSQAAETTETDIKKLLNQYLEALEENDTEVLLQSSRDVRFPNKEDQREAYDTMSQDITDTNIVNIQQVKAQEYEATVKIEEDGKSIETTFPIRRADNEWNIIVGQDY